MTSTKNRVIYSGIKKQLLALSSVIEKILARIVIAVILVKYAQLTCDFKNFACKDASLFYISLLRRHSADVIEKKIV